MLEKFGSIVDLSQTKMFHANIKPHPPSGVLDKSKSPATEIILAYFPSNYPRGDQDKFEEGWAKLVQALEKHAGGFVSSAGGWVIENLEFPTTGEDGIVFLGLLGWESVKHHIDFRSTAHFAENIHHLRGAKDLKDIKVVHYHGNNV